MHLLRYYILIFSFVFCASLFNTFAQSKPDGINALIKIEDAFNNGDVGELSQFIDNKTYFSFTSDLSGYYSYSQIYNLLKDYFEAYKPIRFKFSSKSKDINSPFGWGEYVYLKNGMRGSHKIFISLQKSGPNYYISQISIN